jgi:hypothetical protein
MSGVLGYMCKQCNTLIKPQTKKKLIFCKCGRIGIDGDLVSSRIIGNKSFVKVLEKEEVSFAYRIKNTKSGLYFSPYKYPSGSTFSKNGKVYMRKPSLSWVSKIAKVEDCVVEKYKLEIV